MTDKDAGGPNLHDDPLVAARIEKYQRAADGGGFRLGSTAAISQSRFTIASPTSIRASRPGSRPRLRDGS